MHRTIEVCFRHYIRRRSAGSLAMLAASEINDEEDRWAMQAVLMATKAKAREAESVADECARPLTPAERSALNGPLSFLS
jgi:hypothetical protein